MSTQNHLNFENTINLGSFYTPKNIVQIAYEMLEKHIDMHDFILLDSSCGYGDFFIKDYKFIAADIDKFALSKVRKGITKFHTNSLQNANRKKFNLCKDDKLIIIGNPPYNDKTSEIKSGIKKEIYHIDSKLKHRDLGISFLRSYAVLNPEFICVLHPLSYLIKKTNFNALNDFKNNYKLLDSVIISSSIFTPKSSSFFPIIIALYEKNSQGMDFEFIQNFEFKTIEKQKFKLKNFDFISNYVQKYPNHKDSRKAVGYFYTLRDINALKRNRTFLEKPITNSVKIFEENLKYYCYIHHFKNYATSLPYFLGNFDVFINNDEFLKIENEFLNLNHSSKIDGYFENLFREFL